MKNTRFAILVAVALSAGPAEAKEPLCETPHSNIAPNILGLTPDAARRVVESCGFVWAPHATGTLSLERVGTIGKQDPKGGTVVDSKGNLTSFVSKGIFLPNFVGKQGDTSIDFLKNLSLNAETKVVHEFSDTVPEGIVIRQTPIADAFHDGTQLFGASMEIILTISKGKKPVPTFALVLPDECSLEAVLATLNNQGLVARHVSGPKEPEFPVCTQECFREDRSVCVKDTRPAEGEPVSVGQIVEIDTRIHRQITQIPPPNGMSVCPPSTIPPGCHLADLN